MRGRFSNTLHRCAARTHAGFGLGLAAVLLIIGCQSLQSAAAEGDTRTISMHHLHTGETITITYKRDGRYVPSALKKLDWFLRDWREHKQTNMDPHLIDLLWLVDRDVGGTRPIQIVCGYRDEHTNKMLRHRSKHSGVAVHSQHILGKAIDFYIPGVPLAKLRAIGLQLQIGGVGFYPTSGSPFVHMDVGDVRHWPRMTRQQLVHIFPDGRTVHVPTDGRPLRHYAQALLEVERHGGRPSVKSLQAAERAGAITDRERIAAQSGNRTLLAALLGKPILGKPIVVAKSDAPAPHAADARLASPSPPWPQPDDVDEDAMRAATVVLASADPTPSEIVRSRFYWVGMPQMNAAGVTVTARWSSWSGAVLALAAPRHPVAPAAQPPLVDPWLDAVIITPSVRRYFSATRYGVRHERDLASLFDKPASAVAMTFARNETPGPGSERFAGHAIVFVETVTFAAAEPRPFDTASLPY